MILFKLPSVIGTPTENDDRFQIIEVDVQTKQQAADFESLKITPLKSVRLVAKSTMENVAAFQVEDENGLIHRVGHKNYYTLGIDKLALPDIQYPPHSKTPTPAEALVILANYAPEAAVWESKESAYTLPIEVALARNILGVDVYKFLVNAMKVRK